MYQNAHIPNESQPILLKEMLSHIKNTLILIPFHNKIRYVNMNRSGSQLQNYLPAGFFHQGAGKLNI